MIQLAVNGGTPHKTKPFPNWPVFDETEKMNLQEVLESGAWWRVTGSKVRQFETEFARMQGMPYCLGVTNGTSAIQLALMAFGIGKGDEVILPAMTFISTALAVLECGAYPVLADIDEESYCLDPDAFERLITAKTKAVIPVHMAGNACDMQRICQIAREHGIRIIEDAAHAHGGEYRQHRLGSFGDASIFSFQNGKLMTCGEGGALLFRHREDYEKAYVMQDVGRPLHDKIYRHVYMGANFRMDEFHAAILLAQMKRVDSMNALREKNAAILDSYLRDVPGIIPQGRADGCNIFSHYMYMFRFDSRFFGNMDRLGFVEALNAEGIPANVCFPVISDTEFFRENNFRGKLDGYVEPDRHSIRQARQIADNAVWLHHRVLEGDLLDLQETVGAIKKIQQASIEK